MRELYIFLSLLAISSEIVVIVFQDRIGLRTLYEKGKLQFVAIDGDHLQMPETVFIKEIVNKYLK